LFLKTYSEAAPYGVETKAFEAQYVSQDISGIYKFDIHGSVHYRLLSRKTNKMQLCNKTYYSKVY